MTSPQVLEHALATRTTDEESLWVLVKHLLDAGNAVAFVSTWALIDDYLKANHARLTQAEYVAIIDRYEELISE